MTNDELDRRIARIVKEHEEIVKTTSPQLEGEEFQREVARTLAAWIAAGDYVPAQGRAA